MRRTIRQRFSPLFSLPHVTRGEPALPTAMEALPFWCGKDAECVKHAGRFGGDVDSRTMSSNGKHFIANAAVRLALDQQMDRALGQILDRLADRGQRRPHDLRHRRIVEPGHRHCLRESRDRHGAEPASRRRPYRRSRRRSRSLRRRSRSSCSAASTPDLNVKSPLAVQGWPRRSSASRSASNKAVVAQRRRPVLRRALDEADAAMSKRRQVPSDGMAARTFVDAHGQDRSRAPALPPRPRRPERPRDAPFR